MSPAKHTQAGKIITKVVGQVGQVGSIAAVIQQLQVVVLRKLLVAVHKLVARKPAVLVLQHKQAEQVVLELPHTSVAVHK